MAEVTEKQVYHLADMAQEIETFNRVSEAYNGKFTRKSALELRKSLLRIGKICDAGRKEVQDAVKAKYGDTDKEEKTEKMVAGTSDEAALPVKAKSVKAAATKEASVKTVEPSANKAAAKTKKAATPAPAPSTASEKATEKAAPSEKAPAKKAPPKKKTT